jgi:hypothetical protein
MIGFGPIPVHQWTHREFDGVDPWANNQPVRWSVVVYRMVSEMIANVALPATKQTVRAESNEVPKKFAIGIFAKAHNRYRVLPLVLQDLWRAGKVRDEDLPWLLNKIEQRLWRRDYPPNPLQPLMLVYAIMFGVFTAIALGAYLFFAPFATHVRQFTNAEQWAKQPIQPDRSLNVHGELPIVGMFQLRSPVRPPTGLRAEQDGDSRSILAVVQATGEKRLALTVQKSNLVNTSGVVIRAHTAGLPDAVLLELKRRYPDLNTDYVLSTGWNWPNAVNPDEAETYQVILWIAAGMGLISLLSLSLYMWCRRRRRSQAENWLDLLHARSVGLAA